MRVFFWTNQKKKRKKRNRKGNQKQRQDKNRASPKRDDIRQLDEPGEGREVRRRRPPVSETDRFAESFKEKEQKGGLLDSGMVGKLIELCREIRDKIKKDGDGNSNIWGTIKTIVSYPERKAVLKETLRYLKRVKKSIHFGRFTARGRCGFGDPAKTGYLLGLCGILESIVPADIRLTGDFENSVLQGEAAIKGRVYVTPILLHTVMFVLSKPIFKAARQIIKHI